jgi:hypothetical protein
MAWVHFWDMHSGGKQKLDWANIFIEAPDEEEASRYFESRFGRSPGNVTCQCCGEDYSVSVEPSLKQATGYHRGCRVIEAKRDPVTRLYKNDDPVIAGNWYLERDEEPPAGYSLSGLGSSREWISIEDYTKQPNVLVVRMGDR